MLYYQNTPKGRGSSIEESLKEMKQALFSLRESGVEISEAEIENALLSFTFCLEHANDYKAIQNFPNMYGFGAFKEVYQLTSNTVIKFCSESNRTKEEERLLLAAKKENVSEMFLPTEFVSLGDIPMSMPFLDEADAESGSAFRYNTWLHDYTPNPDHIPSKAVYCEIQPAVTVNCDSKRRVCCYYENYIGANFVYYNNGGVIPFEEIYKIPVTDMNWIQSIITCYGDEFFKRFVTFIVENHVSDLHSSNIGYISSNGTQFPIIFDWLSAAK